MSKNIEDYKTYADLEEVAEADRVPGRIYFVSDYKDADEDDNFAPRIYDKDNCDRNGTDWKRWFAIPPCFIGLPEMPKVGDRAEGTTDVGMRTIGTITGYEINNCFIVREAKLIAPPERLPSISIAEGTKEQQIAELKKALEALNSI